MLHLFNSFLIYKIDTLFLIYLLQTTSWKKKVNLGICSFFKTWRLVCLKLTMHNYIGIPKLISSQTSIEFVS